MMKDLSIIIPAYNEAQRIIPTLERFDSFLAARNQSYEIIVLDDGSTDDTVCTVAKLAAKRPHISLRSLPQNRGKGAAVRTGMLAANGAIRLFSDADGSTPPEDLEKLLDAMRRNALDIAIGSRYLEGSEVVKAQPKFRVAWSRLTNSVIQRILLPGIQDPHCGFKAYTAAAAQQVFTHCIVDGWSFDLEALAIARRLNLKMGEVPVRWANDERSKGRLSHLPREIRDVYRIRKRLKRQSTI